MIFSICAFNIFFKTIFYWLPYLSNIIEEELLKPETFIMLTKNKRRHEIKELDFDLDLPLKLRHGVTKLKSCMPGVWRFTGTR